MKRNPTIWSENHGKDNFITEYPDYSMFSHLLKTAQRHPDYIALEFQNKKTSFSHMIADIELIAQSLLACGIKKGDYVSVVAPNTPQTLTMVYAVNRIGAVANMIHPLLSPAEIKQFVEKVNSSAVLTFDMLYSKFADMEWNTSIVPVMIIARIADALPMYLKPLYLAKNNIKPDFNPSHNIIYWNDFIKRGKEKKTPLPLDSGKGDDVAVILYSGGTTGIPKGVMIQNKAFNAMAIQSSEIKPLDTSETAGKKVLAMMPAFHGFGLAMCMHVMLSFGCHLFIVPKFDYKVCSELIFKKKISYIYAVPALFEVLSRTEEIEKKDLSFMEMVAYSGDKCDKKLLNRMNRYLEKGGSKARMMEAYGLTESLSGVCINPFFAMKEGSTGLPFPDNKVKIVRLDTTETAPLGEDGEICVTGPTLMKGYYKNEAETAHALRRHEDGEIWLHTGDIGCMDEDGYVYYRQRHSRMIIVSGYNVYPTQIEDVINKCPSVAISCVIGLSDKLTGQRVVAVVQPTSMSINLDKLKKELFELCEKNVAAFSMPKEIVFREELPRTAMGKVSFRKLVDEMESKKG